MESYYDDPIKSVVRYRIDPPPVRWGFEAEGWRSAYNSITGLRLRVTDEAIEVRGFGPFRRLLEAFPFGPKLSLPPRETTMSMAGLGGIASGRWGSPWPKSDYLALSRTQPDDGSEYTLAVRPSDGDYDRLTDALRSAGVSDC